MRGSLQSALGLHKTLQAALEHHRAGRLAQASALCQQMLQAKPDHHQALYLSALIAGQMRRNDRAVEFMHRAVQAQPSNPVYHYNLGFFYSALNRPDDAIACYQKALAFKPDFAEALNNLGILLKARGRLDEAIACFRKALALKPDIASTYYNLGHILKNQGKADEAIACFRKALALKPDYVEAYNNLGNILKDLGRNDEALACFRQAVALRPDSAEAFSNYLMNAHYTTSMTPDALFAEHLQFAARFEAPLKPSWQPHINSRDPGRRLRVGYLSGDFHNHPVTYFLEPVLACHDRLQFEVFCYYTHDRHDNGTDGLKAVADHWLPCTQLSDEQLAARIRADGIDILVDLSGHTARNRLLVFARKPAPVQVTWLGYIDTTGLSAMDYRLTHGDTDPPGNDAYYSETLYRLPGDLWWCYRPRPGMPAVAPPPFLTNGFVTFGSTNNFAKLSPETLAVWAEILHAVPNAHLLIAGVPEGATRNTLIERFAVHGIAGQRLTIEGRVPFAQFWELHRRIDIALDPFPYNGGTTTCDALWLGVPVVALTGQTFVSRMGYALLKNIGLPKLAAADTRGYVDIAVGLARDPDRLNSLRAGLRARLEASPLRNETGFTRNLEAAYREMWRTWCNGVQLKPDRPSPP